MALKLLFSAAFDTRLPVGISRYIRRLAPELARLCELTILSPDPEIFSDVCQTIRLPPLIRHRDAKVLWSMTRLRHYCKRGYDVLLCATPTVPIGGALPRIAIVHDITPLAMHHLHGSRDKAVFLLGLQTLHQADCIIADSSYTRRDLLAKLGRLNPCKVSVAYPGPGLGPAVDDGSGFARQFAPYILYVGGHAAHKNLARLISAFARLRRDDSLKLVIVGARDVRLQGRASSRARLLNIAGRVVLLDSVTDNQLSALYQGCQVFVYPSLYEGFGLPVLEAMTHAAPIACSRATSIPEVGGNAVEYFDPLSVDDIHRKIQLLLDDRDLAQKLAVAGLIRSSLFSWERTAQAIYRNACALTSGPGQRH
jgi:glycosyltransferase involved in cell wall biosynthesis